MPGQVGEQKTCFIWLDFYNQFQLAPSYWWSKRNQTAGSFPCTWSFSPLVQLPTIVAASMHITHTQLQIVSFNWWPFPLSTRYNPFWLHCHNGRWILQGSVHDISETPIDIWGLRCHHDAVAACPDVLAARHTWDQIEGGLTHDVWEKSKQF